MQPLRVEIGQNQVVFTGENKKGGRVTRTVDVSGCCIERDILTEILELVRKRSGTLSENTSQMKVVEQGLVYIIEFFSRPNSSYPENSHEWQLTLLNFFRYVLVVPSTNKQISTRRNIWNYQIRKLLFFMRDHELIPIDVEIPKAKTKKQKYKHKEQSLLGKTKPVKVDVKTPVRKLLVNLDYTRTDAGYLDSINEECIQRASALKRVCLKYFAVLKRDHKKGREIASLISKRDIEDALEAGTYKRRSGRPRANKTNLSKVTNPDVFSDSHVWALARLRYLMNSSDDPACISTASLSKDDFFPSNVSACLKSYASNLKDHSAYNDVQYSHLTKPGVIYRFAGVLLNLDMIVLSCLLIHEHPNVNPDSILNAQLANNNGKPYFVVDDKGEKRIFSVDKPRAHDRKVTVLTPLSKKILEFIIETTSPIRRMLKSSKQKQWRMLFLGLQYGNKLGPLRGKASAHLIGGNKGVTSLIDLYPSLIKSNLKAGTLSLSSLRNTMGIIKWFETGSVREMARVMGNTHRVVVEHYIPPSLMAAWNNRLIRRFQQTLIILAAYDEDYLLDVSDFSGMTDLTSFMVQLFFTSKPGRSPIDSVIHSKLRKRFAFIYGDDSGDDVASDAQFNLHLSPKSLATLYCYSEIAVKLPESERKRLDPFSRVSPQHFINLGRMIAHVCEAEKEAEDHVISSELESLRRCHQQAVSQQNDVRRSFEGVSLSSEWGDL